VTFGVQDRCSSQSTSISFNSLLSSDKTTASHRITAQSRQKLSLQMVLNLSAYKAQKMKFSSKQLQPTLGLSVILDPQKKNSGYNWNNNDDLVEIDLIGS